VLEPVQRELAGLRDRILPDGQFHEALPGAVEARLLQRRPVFGIGSTDLSLGTAAC
jgi:hypothetical protein